MTTLEESVFFIKPPALEQAEKIINELKKQFTVAFSDPIALPADFWLTFHENEISPYKEANASYLADKKIILGIVKGENAKIKLFELCGKTFNPEACSSDSLRYRYRFEPSLIQVDGVAFYVNAIHRSMPEDAQREVNLVRPFIKPRLICRNQTFTPRKQKTKV